MALQEEVTPSTMRVVVRDPPIEIPGPEDIVIDHAAKIALVASQQRVSPSRRLLEPNEMPGGAVYKLDLSSERLVPRLLVHQDSLGFPFHPHGCSLFVGETGERRLMVISHRSNSDHVVEIFDVTGETFDALRLNYLHTVVDAEHLVSPNDLVALDGERFYVGNDHGARSKLLRSVEDLSLLTEPPLPLSTVSFWDGNRGHTVAAGISFANGVALDRARGRLYVAATRSRKISVYPLDEKHPAKWLVESESIPLPGCPDNLEWDEEGNLWIGADPSFLRLGLFSLGILKHAPSQVLCVSFGQQHEARVQEVWRDETGDVISASSVAAVHGKGRERRLLIGQPFGNFLRDCELRS